MKFFVEQKTTHVSTEPPPSVCVVVSPKPFKSLLELLITSAKQPMKLHSDVNVGVLSYLNKF